jgi:hypothetical protein
VFSSLVLVDPRDFAAATLSPSQNTHGVLDMVLISLRSREQDEKLQCCSGVDGIVKASLLVSWSDAHIPDIQLTQPERATIQENEYHARHVNRVTPRMSMSLWYPHPRQPRVENESIVSTSQGSMFDSIPSAVAMTRSFVIMAEQTEVMVALSPQFPHAGPLANLDFVSIREE